MIVRTVCCGVRVLVVKDLAGGDGWMCRILVRRMSLRGACALCEFGASNGRCWCPLCIMLRENLIILNSFLRRRGEQLDRPMMSDSTICLARHNFGTATNHVCDKRKIPSHLHIQEIPLQGPLSLVNVRCLGATEERFGVLGCFPYFRPPKRVPHHLLC